MSESRSNHFSSSTALAQKFFNDPSSKNSKTGNPLSLFLEEQGQESKISTNCVYPIVQEKANAVFSPDCSIKTVYDIQMDMWAATEDKDEVLYTGGVMNCLTIIVHNRNTQQGALAHYNGSHAADNFMTLGLEQNTINTFNFINKLIKSMVNKIKANQEDEFDIILWKGCSFTSNNQYFIDRDFSIVAKQFFKSPTYTVIDLMDKNKLNPNYSGVIYNPKKGRAYFLTQATDLNIYEENGFKKTYFPVAGVKKIKQDNSPQDLNTLIPVSVPIHLAEEKNENLDLFKGLNVKMKSSQGNNMSNLFQGLTIKVRKNSEPESKPPLTNNSKSIISSTADVAAESIEKPHL